MMRGEMKIAGDAVRFGSPEPAVRKGIGYVPRERRLEGLVMFLSIAENISLADLSSVMRHGAIDYGKERRLAADWIKRLRIKAPGPDAACRKLSGGNQQKVVLARWMTAGSRILVLDHPTRGLDVGAKEEVYELVRDLSRARRGDPFDLRHAGRNDRPVAPGAGDARRRDHRALRRQSGQQAEAGRPVAGDGVSGR